MKDYSPITDDLIVAVKDGDFTALDKFVHVHGSDFDVIKAMLGADEFLIFRLAAYYDKPIVLDKLLKLATPKIIANAVLASDFKVMHMLALHGQLKLFNGLLKYVSPQALKKMLNYGNYYIFRETAINGHLAMLNRLLELLDPKDIHAMITAPHPHFSDYRHFELVACYGYVSILNRLLELAPAEFIATMLMVGDFQVIKIAARHEHFEMVKILLAHCSRQKILDQALKTLKSWAMNPTIFEVQVAHYDDENSDLRRDVSNIDILMSQGVTNKYFYLLSIANQMITPPFQIQRPITLCAERCLKMGWLDSRQKIVCDALNQGNLLLPPLIGIVVGYIGEKAELSLGFTSINASSSFARSEPIVMEGEVISEIVERKEKSWADVVKQGVTKKNPPPSRSSE